MSVTSLQLTAKVDAALFGELPDGRPVYEYALLNGQGVEARIISFGAALRVLRVPDRDGVDEDVVLGFDDLQDYLGEHPYFGATTGRFAGRIKEGRFVLDGKVYQLTINNGPNHLHGGVTGLNRVLWDARILEGEEEPAVEFTCANEDGAEGYPGNLSCSVIYRLTADNELRITYRAVTDKPTIVNLTHHSYFNLAGHTSGDILGHELTVYSDYYAPAEPEWLIPTGEIRSVKHTSLDFRRPMSIGTRIEEAPEDLGGNNGGYDLNYLLKNEDRYEVVARLHDPKSGRTMEVLTTEPALQFYTSNFMTGTDRGKGAVYQKYAAVCLEPQHLPDSPNEPHFPSTVLRPGEVYTHTIGYRFLVD